MDTNLYLQDISNGISQPELLSKIYIARHTEKGYHSSESTDNIDLTLEVQVGSSQSSTISQDSAKNHFHDQPCEMDHDKCVNVTIIEPDSQFPTLNELRVRSAKALSTIQECDSPRDDRTDTRNELIPEDDTLDSGKLEFSQYSNETKGQSEDPNQPFDIGLLLRHYARNSNMEKSIRKVIEEADKKRFNYPDDQVCRDISNDGSLSIELSAMYKIFDLLLQSSSDSSSLNLSHCREILTTLRYLLDQCSNKQFEDLLSGDPSLKMCKHCGVISCSMFPKRPADPPRSPPRSSYFLNTQTLTNDTADDKAHAKMFREKKKYTVRKECDQRSNQRFVRNVDKVPNKEENNINYSNVQGYYRDNKKNLSRETNCVPKRRDKFETKIPRRIETMAAEREDGNEAYEISASKNQLYDNMIRRDIKLRNDRVIDDRLAGISFSKQYKSERNNIDEIPSKNRNIVEDEISTRLQLHDQINHGITTNVGGIAPHAKPRNPTELAKIIRSGGNSDENESKFHLRNNERTVNESEEEIKHISYLGSKSQLSNYTSGNCLPLQGTRDVIDQQDRRSIPLSNLGSMIDTVKYLASGRVETANAKEKEYVSQLGERKCMQSRRVEETHSFALYRSRDDAPELDVGFWLCDKSKQSRGAPHARSFDPATLFANHRDSGEHCERVDANKSLEKTGSFARSVEKDSLENFTESPSTFVEPGESDTTAFSSSSAENMIREWVKPLRKDGGNDVYDGRSVTPKPSAALERRVKGQTIVTTAGRIDYPLTSNGRLCNPQIDNSIDTWHVESLKDQSKIHFTASQIPSPGADVNSKLQSTGNSKAGDIRSKSIDHSGVIKNNSTSLRDTNNSHKSGVIESDQNHRKITYNDFDFPVPPKTDTRRTNTENFTRRITYDETSLKNMANDSRYARVAEILPVYRKILEGTEKMDWECFQRFIENLHPGQKNLWRDICDAIGNEAKRMADMIGGNTEVCIEISPLPREEKKDEARGCRNEIVLEMDMTLEDVERLLGKKLPSNEEEQLDTHNRANDGTEVRNDDVCYIEENSNQAE